MMLCFRDRDYLVQTVSSLRLAGCPLLPHVAILEKRHASLFSTLHYTRHKIKSPNETNRRKMHRRKRETGWRDAEIVQHHQLTNGRRKQTRER